MKKTIKVKGKGNGHKPEAVAEESPPQLEPTAEMVEALTQAPQEPPPQEDNRLAANFVENSMRQAEQETALGLLVKPGDSTQDILMRTNVPSKVTEGVVKAMSAIRIIMQCREDGDLRGEQEVWYALSLLPSVDGARAKMLVEAVTGSSRPGEENSRSISSWIKKNAYGTKE